MIEVEVPETHFRAATDALGREAEFSVLGASLGRSVLLTDTPSGKMVLKVYDLAVVLRPERRNLGLAAEVGLPVPKEICFAEGPPCVLAVSHIPGRALQAGDPPKTWREVGRLIKKFESVDVPAVLDADLPWDELVIRRFEEELALWGDRELLSDDQSEELLRRLRRLAPVLAQREMRFCHNDLQPAHVLVDPASGRVEGIVDLADARIADPVLDLAVVSMEPGAPTEELLAGYGDLPAGAEQLIPWYRLLKHLGGGTWVRKAGMPAWASEIEKSGQTLAESLLRDEC